MTYQIQFHIDAGLNRFVNLSRESLSDLIPRRVMKISSEARKAISLILFYTALLFFLIGVAARMKSNFHSRTEISTAGFVTAAILATLGAVVLLFSSRGRQR